MSFLQNVAKDAGAITPSDTVEPVIRINALYVGATGNVAVITSNGSTVTFVGVPGGTILPVSVQMVLATGTTASSIVGLSA
jgi:hypothetical protein